MPPGAVYGLHILAADDVWAAGDTGSGAAVSHWNGEAWQQTIVDGFPRSAVSSVLAVSPTEVWAGGTAGFVGGPAGRPIPPLLVRFDGQAWSRVTVPTDFGSISSLSPSTSGALAWVSVARSQKWGPPGSSPPFVPGPDFLAWNGQSFTEYSEPAVAGEGDSSGAAAGAGARHGDGVVGGPRRRPRGHLRPTHPAVRLRRRTGLRPARVGSGCSGCGACRLGGRGSAGGVLELGDPAGCGGVTGLGALVQPGEGLGGMALVVQQGDGQGEGGGVSAFLDAAGTALTATP